jgi:hypothetical protein
MKLFSEKILLVPDTGFRLFFFPLGPDPDNVGDLGLRDKIQANREACRVLADGSSADFDDAEHPGWKDNVTKKNASP